MNADNFTLFNVTAGNTYEWSYCESHQGVSTAWDAQLTLSDNSSGTNLCFSDNFCGVNANAPYLSWTATFTGVVKLLTSLNNCLNNSGAPYNNLVWRMANGTPSALITGVDVSSYEGNINWANVKNAGYKFGFAKATEGVSITDSYFINNQVNGAAAGLPMGAYHFARPENNSATAEANYFLSVASAYIHSCNLPPVLDVENPPTGPSLQTFFTSAQLTTWIQTWCTTVQNATGIAPIIYIGPSNAAYLNSSINTYGLWIDDYNSNPNNAPANIGVWTTWEFKQYSWTGTVPGISGAGGIDMDVFNGDTVAFKALLGCNSTGMVQHSSEINFQIYPNPAKSVITIENISLDNYEEGLISIYTIHGQLLVQKNLEGHKTKIDIIDFTEGMYILAVKTEKGMKVKKFIKE